MNLGDPVPFCGGQIFRPKDGLMVMMGTHGLMGEKTSLGLMTLVAAASKEDRELVMVSIFDPNSEALERLVEHGVATVVN